MRLAIVGAGAIGSALGGYLARAGHEVALVCRGAHLEAIQAHGLTVQAPDGEFIVHPAASDRPETFGPQDGVILCAKAYSLPELAPRLTGMLGPETPILSTQNGLPWWALHGLEGPGAEQPLEPVDPGGVMWRVFGPERGAACPVAMPAAIVAPGITNVGSASRIALGAPLGRHAAFLAGLARTLGECGIPVEFDDAHRAMWTKARQFIAGAMVAMLTEVSSPGLAKVPGVPEFTGALMGEVIAVAAAWGIEIPLPPKVGGHVRAGGTSRPSIWQDFEAGKPIELDATIGAVLEMGSRRGVDTRLLRALHTLILVKMARRDRLVA